MKQMSLTTIAVGASTFACAALLSFGWSEQRGVSLSVENAQARVGRPLTPVSVAGVARRQNRRAAYGAAGAVEMGRYGNGPNNLGGLVGGDDPGTGGGAGGLYYGGRVRGASASYYGGYPSGAWGGVSSSDRALYIKNLHDSGLAR